MAAMHGAKPVSGVHENMPSQDMRLEFQVADIGQRVEIPDLTAKLYYDMVAKVDERDIIGVQVVPLRWPRKVQILCAHQAAKDCLMIRGVDLYGRHIELSEPGNFVKVVISDAPLDMRNDIIKDFMMQYGTVTEFRNEHMIVQGRKTSWRTGNRYAFIKMLKQPVPPSAKIKCGDQEVQISMWHFGQTHIKCRFCHENVPKGHKCDKAPARRCYDCGSDSHTRINCTEGRSCYRCGSKEHLSRECTTAATNSRSIYATAADSTAAPAASPVTTPVAPPVADPVADPVVDNVADDVRSQADEEAETVDDVQNESRYSEATDSSIIIDRMEDIHDHSVEVVLIGGSNCRDIKLQGDDQLHIQTTPLIQGGIKIDVASEKLEEINEQKKGEVQVVVVNVGTCEFPVQSDNDVDILYTEYVELLHGITNACPHANIIMSSLLPRSGERKEKVNSQIQHFNEKIADLSIMTGLSLQKTSLHFCDNDIHFRNEAGVINSLYRDTENLGLHINQEGKKRLESSITDCIKEMYFSQKLAEEQALS